MNPSDRGEFCETLAPLFAAFGKALSEDQADAYWRYLRDLPMADVLEGIAAAGRKSGRYVPSVGQIRECIEAATSSTRDTRALPGCPDCSEGWRFCEQTIRADEAFGPYAAKGHDWVRTWVEPCHCAAGQGKRRGRVFAGAA